MSEQKTKEVKKLENKIKNLEKELESSSRRFNRYYTFYTEFLKFKHRVFNRKFVTDWPIQRFDEALLSLERIAQLE